MRGEYRGGARPANARAPERRTVRMCIAMSETRLMLTCGLPGAGKTTLATELSAERGALRLTQDEWLIARLQSLGCGHAREGRP